MTSDEARWNAELEHLGKTAVAAKLMSGGVGPGSDAELKLSMSGLENPTRGYVEEWLGRLDREEKADRAAAKADRAAAKADRAEAKVVDARRFHYIFWPVLVASLAAVFSLLHEWIK